MKKLIAMLAAKVLLMSASWGMSKRELEKLLEEGKRRQPPYVLIFDSQKRPIGYVDAQRKNFSIESACIPVRIVGTINTVELGNAHFDIFRVEQDGVVFTVNIGVSEFSRAEASWLPTLLAPQRKVAMVASQCGQEGILEAITVMILP